MPFSPHHTLSGSFFRIFVVLLLVIMLPSCGTRPLRIKNIAKSDIDLVADAHRRETISLLRELMIKLYKKNPSELQTQSYPVDYRLAQLFGKNQGTAFSELQYKQSTEALQLCFDNTFKGDRVFALMAGLTSMIRQSYNNQEEFFLFDTLDQQKLYNSARNLEIVAWRLADNKDEEQRPFLLTNELSGDTINISFERIFGKMIAVQDMMARIVADRTNRTINRVVHTLATATFLPVGM